MSSSRCKSPRTTRLKESRMEQSSSLSSSRRVGFATELASNRSSPNKRDEARLRSDRRRNDGQMGAPFRHWKAVAEDLCRLDGVEAVALQVQAFATVTTEAKPAVNTTKTPRTIQAAAGWCCRCCCRRRRRRTAHRSIMMMMVGRIFLS